MLCRDVLMQIARLHGSPTLHACPPRRLAWDVDVSSRCDQCSIQHGIYPAINVIVDLTDNAGQIQTDETSNHSYASQTGRPA